jgi:hypothetical protein
MTRIRSRAMWVVCGAAAAVAVVSCSRGEDSVRQSDVYRAQEALRPFQEELKGALLEGLEDGPRGAILVCKSAAPAIAARRNAEGVEMGRTSHKLRNPANAPAEWLRPLLADYTSGARDPYLAVVLEDGRIGYVEPIYVQKPCLMCHGATIAPAVAEQIAEEYPDDQATGFHEGDFRGLFWVKVPRGAEE